MTQAMPDTTALQARLNAPGPKRILSLDGGGTRGVVALAFLQRIEDELCRPGAAKTLSDHFDLIGGTSTGAIIAAALALGWRVDRIREIYRKFAVDVFQRRWWRVVPIMNRYDPGKLEDLLKTYFGHDSEGRELVVGSAALRTGLAVVAKRVDTGSPWVVSNLPGAPYHRDHARGATGNWRIPLRNLVRASTAAPTFFRPVTLPLGPRGDGTIETGRFVDGGATPYNNPAMRLFELARLGCFGLRWPPGKDSLLIVSIGAGRFRTRQLRPPSLCDGLRPFLRTLPQRLMLFQAIGVLEGMIGDGSTHALRSLQSLGHLPLPVRVDSEVGDMAQDLLGTEPLFTALRYDLDLDDLLAQDALTLRDHGNLCRLDAPECMDRLFELASAAAAAQVDPAHLHLPAHSIS